ncbi:cellulase family glycosylhydrolase [Deinococcus saxicola]|uniref:glycoside hydrolase family 5 protein n=1 Tax=Deinococcus saxicola TaxID=249406 RepID=UPI0039F0869A
MKTTRTAGLLLLSGLLSLSACGQPSPQPDAAPMSPPGLTSQDVGTQNWSATSAGGQTTLYNGGVATTLRGINWFGLDSGNQLGGVWTSDGGRKHDLDFWMARIRALGFNAVRLPLSADTIYNDGTGKDRALTAAVQKAAAHGLHVVLDFQTCSTRLLGGQLVGDPSRCPDRAWNLNYWLDYMDKLARFAQANRNVAAIDLFNEPHAISWGTWKAYAEQAVSRMEQTYGGSGQNVLYFVEGTGGTPNWGADISAVNTPANRLFGGNSLAGQIVYSPHFYGKYVSAQAAASIVSGAVNSGANVVIGEFGMVPGDTRWGADLISATKGKGRSSFYWALNANEGDGPYGLLRAESGGNGNWCLLESGIYTTLKNGYGMVSSASTTTVCP